MLSKYIITTMVLVSCIGCNETLLVKSPQNRSRDFSNYQYLSQVLNSIGGIQVEGQHPNVKVYMRGKGSINYNTQPLYVVDGVPIGNSYSQTSNALNVQNIATVSIITGTQATVRFGDMANHGAILIRTKKD